MIIAEGEKDQSPTTVVNTQNQHPLQQDRPRHKHTHSTHTDTHAHTHVRFRTRTRTQGACTVAPQLHLHFHARTCTRLHPHTPHTHICTQVSPTTREHQSEAFHCTQTEFISPDSLPKSQVHSFIHSQVRQLYSLTFTCTSFVHLSLQKTTILFSPVETTE